MRLTPQQAKLCDCMIRNPIPIRILSSHSLRTAKNLVRKGLARSLHHSEKGWCYGATVAAKFIREAGAAGKRGEEQGKAAEHGTL